MKSPNRSSLAFGYVTAFALMAAFPASADTYNSTGLPTISELSSAPECNDPKIKKVIADLARAEVQNMHLLPILREEGQSYRRAAQGPQIAGFVMDVARLLGLAYLGNSSTGSQVQIAEGQFVRASAADTFANFFSPHNEALAFTAFGAVVSLLRHLPAAVMPKHLRLDLRNAVSPVPYDSSIETYLERISSKLSGFQRSYIEKDKAFAKKAKKISDLQLYFGVFSGSESGHVTALANLTASKIGVLLQEMAFAKGQRLELIKVCRDLR